MTDILLGHHLRITCGDVSHEMMQLIDKNLKAHPNYFEERIIDATELPFEDNSFDLILNIRLLHLLDREAKNKIIKEAHRAGKHYFIASFGIDNPWHAFRIKMKQRLNGSDNSPGRMPLREIRNDLERIGFKIIKKKSVLPFFSNEVIFLLQII